MLPVNLDGSHEETLEFGFTTAAAGGSGRGGTVSFPEIKATYPPKLLRPAWIPSSTSDPARDDLYLRTIDDAHLNPRIEISLKMSLRCLRHDLYLPALAVLGTASEGGG